MDALQTVILGAVGLFALATLVLRWNEDRQRERLRWLAEAQAPETRAAMQALREYEHMLLLRVLTPQQTDSYRTTGAFEVQAASGRRYRFAAGMTHNVAELDRQGAPVASLCIGTSRFTSIEGQLAAQVLLLSTNEAAFRKTANIRHY